MVEARNTGAQSIHDRITEVAQRFPDAVALRTGAAELTYAALELESSSLASALVDRNGDGAVVGVCMERGLGSVIAMLAVMKAGGTYLPLDPNFPHERLQYMVRDSSAALVLVDTSTAEIFDSVAPVELPANLSPGDSSVPRNGENAVILYTSGSTGRPKGALLTHKNVLALVDAPSALQHRQGDVVVNVLSPAFDAMLLDVWGALMVGATVFLPSLSAAKSVGHLIDELESAKLTTLPITSSMLHQIAYVRPSFLQTFDNVWFGGEAADVAVIDNLPQGPRYVHHYGPTECTSISTTKVVEPGRITHDKVPIGKPLPSIVTRIVDENLQVVEPGEVGELLIGGAQVGRGYLGQPSLTADRFFTFEGLPFYRTGDLVRETEEGDLVFAGRRDDQVKIRGYRIELGEIEAAVRRAEPTAREVAAVAGTHRSGEARIVVFVSPGFESAENIIASLRSELPEYMIPAELRAIETMPTTATQKIDKRALIERSKLQEDKK